MSSLRHEDARGCMMGHPCLPPISISTERHPQMDAVIALHKPVGPSSAQCLSALKRQGQKKIGHAGTLDPLASGVLIALLGQASKLSSWLMLEGRKTYRGVLRLGMTTDTWDMEGSLLSQCDPAGITPSAIQAEISAWQGRRLQQVPPYSAAKHHGKPLYKLARKGQDAPVKEKCVEIFEADMLHVSMPFVTFRVSCGSGAYIRSLAHSLGVRLGCGAALSELIREYSHPFNLAEACPWEAVCDGTWIDYAVPLHRALPDWPLLEVDADDAAKVRNGIPLKGESTSSYALLYHNGAPLAIGRHQNGLWMIERGLWNN